MTDPRSVDHIHYEHQCRYNRLAEKLEEVTRERDAAPDYASDQAAVIELVAKALGVPDEPHQGGAERILEAASSLAEERDALAAHVSECREVLNWVFFHVPLGADAFAKLKPVVKAEAPATSLARRDSQQQAAAIDKWSVTIIRLMTWADAKHAGDPNYPPISLQMIRELCCDMDDDADRIRRQAEEAPDAQ